MARKVTILARECGLSLELSDIPIESLVPEPLQNVESVDEFMQKLPDYDHEIAAKNGRREASGNKLIFVGVVDVENKKGSVQLKEYPKDHPFAQLKGSDNIISYISKRYTEAGPLVVRRSGRGRRSHRWGCIRGRFECARTWARRPKRRYHLDDGKELLALRDSERDREGKEYFIFNTNTYKH